MTPQSSQPAHSTPARTAEAADALGAAVVATTAAGNGNGNGGHSAHGNGAGHYTPAAGEALVFLPVAREGLPAEPSLGPSARAPARHHVGALNIRRHLLRDAVRVSVLLLSDLAVYGVVRALHSSVDTAPVMLAGMRVVWEGFLPGSAYASLQFVSALALALAVTGNYGAGDRRRDPGRLFAGCALAAALPVWPHFWQSPLYVSADFLYSAAVLGAFVTVARLALDRLVRRHRPFARNAARTVLVGTAADCMYLLGRRSLSIQNGFQILGFVDTEDRTTATALGGVADLDRVLHEHHADTVILCGHSSERTLVRVVRAATVAECELLTVDRAFDVAGVRPSLIWRQGQPLIALRAEGVRGRRLIMKRVFDVAVSASLLVLLAPILLLMALAVYLESPGPVIFGHLRAGRHGRYFRCLKFRSMYADAEQRLRADPELYGLYVENDFKLPPERDTRITRVGRWLRRTSLDELPQLINVLRGDMSLVGPRPVIREELSHYADEEPLLLSLRPGLTGLWQVNGRSNVPYPARKHIELQYVENWSLGRDISILLRTIPAVLMQRGAH